ncbi:hypothetical protein SNEBB_011198 [Seison nebaliae]|nr:hypothetical protein SNEBB_011198 [Seison nebaliae]
MAIWSTTSSLDDVEIPVIDYVFVYRGNMYSAEKELEDKLVYLCVAMQHIGLKYQLLRADTDLIFLCIHTPFEVLLDMAEIVHFPLPIASYECIEDTSILAQLESMLIGLYPTSMDQTEYNKKASVKEYLTLPYSSILRSQFEQYFSKEISKNFQSYFSTAQRSYLTRELLRRIPFSPEIRDEDDEETELTARKIVSMDSRKFFEYLFSNKFRYIGIEQMLSQKMLLAAYAPHEQVDDFQTDRYFLSKNWGNLRKIITVQPVNVIRRYFGEKLTFYFVWLNFYGNMLIPAALSGLIVVLYGLTSLHKSEDVKSICHDMAKTVMCPICDRGCPLWYLRDSCLNAKIGYILGNTSSVLFSLFMAIWSACFIEFWKRKSANIQFSWNLSNTEDYQTYEPIRPEFLAQSNYPKYNHITQSFEPYVPKMKVIGQYLISASACITMIVVCIICVIAIIAYRAIVHTTLMVSDLHFLKIYSEKSVNLLSGIVNLIFILIFGKFYRHLATFLTNREHHKYQSTYDTSLILKNILFDFANNYSSLFYIALFKGALINAPKEQRFRILGVNAQGCDAAGCYSNLCFQSIILFIGTEASSIFSQIVAPYLQAKVVKILPRKIMGNFFLEKNVDYEKSGPTWYTDFFLPEPDAGLFSEYSVLVQQFGFVTLFAVAFPLAPLLALICSMIELRIDAKKFIRRTQRSKAETARNIGIWVKIISAMAKIAVITNAVIIAWTTDFIPRLVYKFAFEGNNDVYQYNSYMNFTLSYYPIETLNITTNFTGEYCRFRGFHEPRTGMGNFECSNVYWYILMARLAFVLVFEHISFLCAHVVDFIIPDENAYTTNNVRKQKFDKQRLLWQSTVGAKTHFKTERATSKAVFTTKIYRKMKSQISYSLSKTSYRPSTFTLIEQTDSALESEDNFIENVMKKTSTIIKVREEKKSEKPPKTEESGVKK